MSKGLTDKQERFSQLVVKYGNQSKAYREAYDVSEGTKDGTVHKRASELAKQLKTHIKTLKEGGTIEYKPTKKPTKGYIYLLHIEGFDFYKIGISQDVPSRKKKIQTLIPFDIKTIKTINVEGYRDIEKMIHKELEEYRYKGEWFKGCLGTILKTFNKYDN